LIRGTCGMRLRDRNQDTGRSFDQSDDDRSDGETAGRLVPPAMTSFTLTVHGERLWSPELPASGYAPDVPRLDGISVVVVDDRADERELLTVILDTAGAQVAAAASADEALDVLARSHADAIVSDLAMPFRDGCALIRELRLSGGPHRDLPAIALTALTRPEDRERALAAGFDCFMTKPMEPRRLVSAVAALVRRRHHLAPRQEPDIV
jgi:CheY-like chemotaxis protein